MGFQVKALSASLFSHLSGLTSDELIARGVRKVIADVSPGFPCRVSLKDAAVGETLYLLNFAHHDEDTPYRSTHAIFVRENAEQARPAVDELPEVLTSRLISVRAFNHAHDMVNADVVAGQDLRGAITAMFENDEVAYLHLHNAKPGCFAARVDRV